MANTTIYEELVEPYVRKKLCEEFGVAFSSEKVTLTTGGLHEFDAVSSDRRIVAGIKSAPDRTSGRNIPSGKIKSAEAELYYLTLAPASKRLLVLTTPEFHARMKKRLDGARHPDIELKLIPLPPELQKQVNAVRKKASAEMSHSQ